jgi:hypothetical protein
MAYTDIDNPELYFQTKLYTGTGSELSITLDGDTDMQPDWVWIKERNGATNQMLTDSVRGATKTLHSQNTDTESTDAQALKSFNSNGFTVGTDGDVNTSSDTYVSWNWKAGTSFTNDASATGIGTIDSAGSVNTTAGFSIVSYTGTGSNGTVAHGLNAVPSMLIVKSRDGAHNWQVLHKSLATNSGTKNLELNSQSAVLTDGTTWNNTAPTSSVFSVGTTNPTNQSGQNLIAYCFAEKTGYSKFGSYTGNGNADGTFVYTGFKPAFVMTKRSNNTENWYILDNKRSPFNPPLNALSPNLSNAEDTNATGRIQDFLSNGFKLRTSDTAVNGSGDTYIYMAFAENPFVTSGGSPSPAR